MDKQISVTESHRLTPLELRAAIALASIFFLRMLGLFMLLPVLALYVDRLDGATPLLIGVALGIYGLTQALMQIPMGRWSDRRGRKTVVSAGLVVFSAGGVVAAAGMHIGVVVAGRALQGAGAVSGALLALAADLSRPEQRTKFMAIIGISIGGAFSVAFVIGPLIDAYLGLRGLFLSAAGLGLVAVALLWTAVPDAARSAMSSDRLDARSLKNPVLRSLQIGAFCLHAILAASFVSIPVALSASGELAAGDHYRVYLPVLLISLICIAPVLMRSHRAGAGDGFYRVAIGFVIAGELLLWWVPAHTLWLGAALTSFFIGFNYLEAALPSLVSRAAPDHGRGGALGTYATAQFLGLFSGGLVGGAVAGAAGYDQVFLVAALVATAWLGYAARVRH